MKQNVLTFGAFVNESFDDTDDPANDDLRPGPEETPEPYFDREGPKHPEQEIPLGHGVEASSEDIDGLIGLIESDADDQACADAIKDANQTGLIYKAMDVPGAADRLIAATQARPSLVQLLKRK
jgi:hypothetical protein